MTKYTRQAYTIEGEKRILSGERVDYLAGLIADGTDPADLAASINEIRAAIAQAEDE